VLTAADSQNWLLEEFTARLGSVFETMAGEQLAIACQNRAEPPAGGLTWQQPFTGVPGAVWLTSAESDFTAIGTHLLLAAGLPDADAESVKSTYFETLSQALSGLAQALSGKLKREVTPEHGQERDGQAASPSASLRWARAEVRLPQQVAVIHIGVEDALLEALAAEEHKERTHDPVAEAEPAASPVPITSKTFDLLLDVELPVSVSFGRAQVQLKDVLKLTTGSIVELNRSITEPVEVIVNNCVIARGEVVVIEGNFGVLIQHVISRQERLRTLH
jgi:flagellar motor switch protein FliN/FliY